MNASVRSSWNVSHHGGLSLQEGLRSGVTVELGHVVGTVPGYGRAVQTIVPTDVALQVQTPPFPLEFTLDLEINALALYFSIRLYKHWK